MAIRKVLLTIVGHVDHGKTSLLDKIRKTAVAGGEAGGITQAIGVSIIPIETIKRICGKLMDVFKGNVILPGVVAIDTPGHAAFTSLRKRGGSLADIAILVVDINEGFKPQTLESIEILKANKVPFIIAANKIDLIEGWKYDPKLFFLDNVNVLDYKIQGELERKMYEIVAQVQQEKLDAERFDRVSDYTRQIAIVPVSAHTGQGIPELLMVLTGLAQRYFEKQLTVEEQGNCKGTILEVKEEKGVGTVVTAIIYAGSLSVHDTIIIAGLDQAITTKVRALLEPVELTDIRDKKSKFKHQQTVTAATGVKIIAPDLEKAIAGMPLRGCSGKAAEIEQLQGEVQQEIGEVVSEEHSTQKGVLIKADTIGGLEALRKLLTDKNIPFSFSSLGDITKRDLSALELMKEKDDFYGVLLGFNVKIPLELEEYIKSKGLKVITKEVIYELLEEYEKYVGQLKKEVELRELSQLVRPCKFFILKGYVFRQNNPAVVGVEIEIGQLKTGDPLMGREGKRLTFVKSMQEGQESLSLVQQGKQFALAMDNVTVGRQIKEGDFLYTDIPEEHFRKLKELKKHLSKIEIEVLKEIAEIKRKDNPVWGMG